MNEIGRALSEIQSIRRQVAQSTEFRGYGPATLAMTACFALFAALAQKLWLQDPAQHIPAYIAIWTATAALSSLVIAIETTLRSGREHSGMADEMIRMAVEQFLPCVGTGALVTIVLARSVPSVLWMLPGLWQIIFSLGVFSSCRFLPRPVVASGAWYLLTSLLCISLGDGRALSPWTMGVSFGVGQLWVAAVLFRHARHTTAEEVTGGAR
jgi:hypothetical protein